MERYSGSGFESHFWSKLKEKNPVGIRARKWMFWEQLQFLMPTMEARQSRDTLKVDKDSNKDNFTEPVCTSGSSAINRKPQMERT